MSGLNQTGPKGQGSITGRRMGKCTNFGANKQQITDNNAQENAPINGLGMGRESGRGQCNRGMRMGRRNRHGNG